MAGAAAGGGQVHHGDHLPRSRGRFSLPRLRHGHRHRRAGQQGDPAGSPRGQVKDFLMNDKCAAGTGRFLEMTMSRVGSDIASIDTFVEGAEPVTINSMCAVFAESEIIGLLAPGDASRQHRSGVHLLHLPPHRYFCPEAGPGAPQGVLLRPDWPSRRWCGRCWPGTWG